MLCYLKEIKTVVFIKMKHSIKNIMLHSSYFLFEKFDAFYINIYIYIYIYIYMCVCVSFF